MAIVLWQNQFYSIGPRWVRGGDANWPGNGERWNVKIFEIFFSLVTETIRGNIVPRRGFSSNVTKLADLRQIGRFVPDWAIFNALDEIFVVQIVTNVATK